MLRKPTVLLFLFLEAITNLPIQEIDSWNESHPQNPEELGDYYEGDIVPKFAKNGLTDETFRWENGTIPYEIKGDFPTKDKNLILKAIDMYSKYTCLSFRPKTRADKDYVSITNYKSGCWSKVGKAGSKQEVNLQSPQCTTKLGTPLHELMHAAGFLHEQNRFERDDYVTINWDNIKDGREKNFDKAEEGLEEGYGVTYDFSSVMHYSSTAFSSNGQRTITPKDMNHLKNMGQRQGFSVGDITKINSMYNCPEKTAQTNMTFETINPTENNEKNKDNNPIWGAFNNLFSIFDNK